jgi:hypothetical protein
MAKAEDMLGRYFPGRLYKGMPYRENDVPAVVSACARTAKRIDVNFPVDPGWWRRESEWFTEWDEILLEAFKVDTLEQVWRRCLRWLEANRAFKLATAYARVTFYYREVIDWENDWMSKSGDFAEWFYPLALGAVGTGVGSGISALIMIVPGGQVAAPSIPYIMAAATGAGAKLGRDVGEQWAIDMIRVTRDRARRLDQARAELRVAIAEWEAA